MAYQVFDNELRLMAKRANQRMVELERRGLAPSSYQAAQSKLAYLGRPARNGVRRFSETGKGTRAEIAQMKKQIRQFLESPTTTLSGLRDVKKRTVESAKRRFGDFSKWMTDDEYMQIWESLGDEQPGYGSQTVFELVETTVRTRKEAGKDVSIPEIVRTIQSSRNYSDAMKSLGITYEDIDQTEELRGNYD